MAPESACLDRHPPYHSPKPDFHSALSSSSPEVSHWCCCLPRTASSTDNITSVRPPTVPLSRTVSFTAVLTVSEESHCDSVTTTLISHSRTASITGSLSRCPNLRSFVTADRASRQTSSVLPHRNVFPAPSFSPGLAASRSAAPATYTALRFALRSQGLHYAGLTYIPWQER